MVYPKHWLLAWGGPLFGGPEQWVNTLRMMPGGYTWPNLPPSWPLFSIDSSVMDDLKTDITNHMMHADSGYSAASPCHWIKFNEIDENGRYSDTTQTHERDLSATPIVPPGTAVYPPQVALCVSFASGRARGVASKGRVYVPSPDKAIAGATARVGATTTELVAAQWASFLTNLSNWPGIDPVDAPRAAIVSNRRTPGEWQHISRVRVGDLLDTQQRRRRQIEETYSSYHTTS